MCWLSFGLGAVTTVVTLVILYGFLFAYFDAVAEREQRMIDGKI